MKDKDEGGSNPNSMKPISGTGPYDVTFTIQGNDAEFDNVGSGLTTKTLKGLSTDSKDLIKVSNVEFYVKTTWNGQNPIQVNMSIDDKGGTPIQPSKGSTDDPNIPLIWTFEESTQCPTDWTVVSGVTGQWVIATDGAYSWDFEALPDVNGPGDYTGVLVTEKFSGRVATFTLQDLRPEYQNIWPDANTAAAAIFESTYGSGGINANDEFSDGWQIGGLTFSYFTPQALANGVGYSDVQTANACGNDFANTHDVGARIFAGIVNGKPFYAAEVIRNP